MTWKKLQFSQCEHLLPVLLLGACSFILWHSRGFYRSSDVIGYLGVVTLIAALTLFRKRPGPDIEQAKWGFALLVFFHTHLLIQRPLLMYSESGLALQSLRWTLISTFGLSGIILLWQKKGTMKNYWVGGLVALLCLSKGLIPWVSPNPLIDVYQSNSQGADYLLSGLNPYGQSYLDIYLGKYDYTPGFAYWPGLLVWIAPFRWLLGDIRYAFIFSDIAIGAALYLFARKQKLAVELSLLISAAWLSQPVHLFVIEQSWTDPILILLTLLHFWALMKQRWFVAALLAGHLVSVKQYGILVPAVTLVYLLSQRKSLRVLSVYFGGALFALVAFTLPFVVTNMDAFLQSTLLVFGNITSRTDSFSATAILINEFGRDYSASLSMGLYLLCGVLISLGLYFLRSDMGQWAMSLFISYSVLFLFAKQAFCNYYYFSTFFLFLYAVFQACRRQTRWVKA